MLKLKDFKETVSDQKSNRMDEGRQTIPTLLSGLSLREIDELIEKYPYFALPRILKSGFIQETLILQDQESTAPLCISDPLYSWYRLKETLTIYGSKQDVNILANHVSDEQMEVAYVPPVHVVTDSGEEAIRIYKDAQIVYIQRFTKENPFSFKIEKSASSYTIKEIPLSAYTKWICDLTPVQPDVQVLIEKNLSNSDQVAQIGLKSNVVEDKASEIVGSQDVIQAPKESKKKEKKNLKKQVVQDLVSQSIADKALLISEPFAYLLVNQGYNEKAIKVFEKLIEKNPAKSAIFAAQIEKLTKSE